MEGLTFTAAFNIISTLGIPGIVFLIWWLDQKSQARMLRAYRDDTQKIINQAAEQFQAARVMYESNVDLVKAYLRLATDLKDIVTLNTQKWQEAHDGIKGNQFCPNVRLKKEAEGAQR